MLLEQYHLCILGIVGGLRDRDNLKELVGQVHAPTARGYWHGCLWASTACDNLCGGVRVQAHLDEARGMQKKIPKEGLPMMLAGLGTSLYLDALEKADFNVMAMQGGGYSILWFMLLLQYHLRRGSF